MFYYMYLYVLDSLHIIVMSLVISPPANVAWGKKDNHPTSQIKAVIVTLTTTKANERQIGYRNKHFGDTGCARCSGSAVTGHESPYPPLAGPPQGGIWAWGRVLVAPLC